MNMILLSFCSECTWELLPMLLGAWILGWLLWSLVKGSGYKSTIADLEGDLSQARATNTSLEKDLSQANYSREKIEADYATLRAKYDDTLLRLNACEEMKANLEAAANADPESPPPIIKDTSDDTPIDMSAAGIISGSSTPPVTKGSEGRIDYAAAFQNDQLQIVEGVGPKIEEHLKNGGIHNWAALAGANQAQLQKILDDAGPRYRMHDPGSWAKQASFAQNGDWAALAAFQRSISGGKEDVKSSKSNQAKIEKMAAKALGITLYESDDLKLVEGIGPKIEALLKAAGIQNWNDLANASTDRIKEILSEAGDRYRLADPGTWSKQAGLAVAEKWKELKEYQDFLQGGKA